MGFMILSLMQIKNGKNVSFFFIHTAYHIYKCIEGEKNNIFGMAGYYKERLPFVDEIHS